MKRVYFETEEQKITRTKGWIEYDTDFTQIYHSFQKLINKFKSVSEMAILFYYCTECNKNGMISTSEDDYNKFIKRNTELGGESINRATFTKCIRNLTENKILIKSTRGVYQLNPLLIWNDSITSRKEYIDNIIESEEPVKTKYLIEGKQ